MSVGAPAATSAVKRGAYRVLALVSASHAVNHAYVALMPMIYPAMMAELAFGYGQLGLLIAVSGAFGQGLQWVAGYLGRYVPRKVLLGSGGIAQGLCVALTGLAQGFGHVLVMQSLTRLAGSPQHPNGNALLLEYFGRSYRGRALALHFAGGNVGTAFVPLVAASLVTALGWRRTLFWFALLGLVVGITVLASVAADTDRSRVAQGVRPPLGRETLAILTHRDLRLIIGAQVSAAGGRGLGIVMTFVPLYLSQELGLTLMSTGVLFTVMMIGSVVGPVLAGFVADRLGARKPLLLAAYAASTVTTLGVISVGAGAPALLPVLLFVLGCVVYAESPLLQSLTADATEDQSPDMVFGLYHTIGFGAGAVWAAAIGALVEAFGFRAALVVMAASYVAAACWILPLRAASARPVGG
jgi:sugar phosphate permease